MITSDPDNDFGDPKEQITRYNKDPSWNAEIKEFESCIVSERPVVSGSSKDALEAMRLVYKIYYNDINLLCN